jgi:hypothetical protein
MRAKVEEMRQDAQEAAAVGDHETAADIHDQADALEEHVQNVAESGEPPPEAAPPAPPSTRNVQYMHNDTLGPYFKWGKDGKIYKNVHPSAFKLLVDYFPEGQEAPAGILTTFRTYLYGTGNNFPPDVKIRANLKQWRGADGLSAAAQWANSRYRAGWTDNDFITFLKDIHSIDIAVKAGGSWNTFKQLHGGH